MSGPSTAASGTNVVLTCTLNGGTSDSIQWIKFPPGGGSSLIFVGTGDHLTTALPKYSNFKLTSLSQNESVLTIKNAEVEDSGVYGCYAASISLKSNEHALEVEGEYDTCYVGIVCKMTMYFRFNVRKEIDWVKI